MKRNQMLIAQMLQFMARETAKLLLGVWHNRDNGSAKDIASDTVSSHPFCECCSRLHNAPQLYTSFGCAPLPVYMYVCILVFMCMITENVATVTAIIISFTMSAQLANSRDQQALYAQNALKGTCIALNCALCYTLLLSACCTCTQHAAKR